MGTIRAGDLIDRVSRNALNDPDNAHWSRDDLRAYIGEGQRAAVLLRPEVNPVTETVQLGAGTKQTIPDDGYVLIGAVRNITTPGEDEQEGRVITPSSRDSLDKVKRRWHSLRGDNPRGFVKNFIYDIRNRKTFYVNPPQRAANPGPPIDHRAAEIEIVYARQPVEPANDNATIDLDDIYEPALIAYMLHRAFAKDIAAEGVAVSRSEAYFAKFVTLITGTAEEKDVELVLRQESRES